MKIKTKDWEIVSKPHDELMDGLDGVRITRRITLRGSVAAAILLALGGCEDDKIPDGEQDDDDDAASGKSSDKNDSGKASGKDKKDPSQKSGGDKSPEDPTEKDSPEDEESGTTAGDDDSEPEESGTTGGESGDGTEDPDKDDSGEKEESPEEEEDLEPLSLDEFLSAIIGEAEKAVKNDKEDEAEYLELVAKFLRRLDHNVPKISAGGKFNMKSLKKRGPVTVYVMEIRANAKIPLHNHINHTGNVLGWRGTCTTRNFTKIDGKAKNGGFLLQETDSRVIKKGDTGILARVHNNFHMLEAGPEGCTLVDVFTYFPRSGSSRYATIGKEPIDPEKKIYEANWNWSEPDLDPRRDFE